MLNLDKFYIDGEWVAPCNQLRTAEFIDPSKEQAIGNVAMADSDDVDRAVKAAHQAFPSYAKLTMNDWTTLRQLSQSMSAALVISLKQYLEKWERH